MNTTIKTGRTNWLSKPSKALRHAGGTPPVVVQRGRWRVVCSEDGTLGRYDNYEDAEKALTEHTRHYPDHDTRILGAE